MNILVIGGGGREHAIVWALNKCADVGKIYCAPGNAGISQIAECLPDIGAMDFDRILAFLDKKGDIDLTVVAPDDPLGKGLVDLLVQNGHKAFGPNKAAAKLEASKSFAKAFMKKYDIPTAEYQVFDSYDEADKYIATARHPLVIKADGLAVGKGVLICNDLSESRSALIELMKDKKHGSAGNRVVIEEFLTGPEITILAFSDGKTIIPMPSSQDHKRALDGDKGRNTGGMGVFSPSGVYCNEVEKDFIANVLTKTQDGLNAEGIEFIGILYFGLMLTSDGIKVIEYNARFGDPETQALLPRLKTSLLDIFGACIDGTLSTLKIEWEDVASVCVILASGGYPDVFKKGYEIKGLDCVAQDITVFHSGTAFDTQGNFVTNGGRVLGVTATGKDMEEARQKAYGAVNKISFCDMHYRTDIGKA